jgi:hypothetical protein
VGVLDESDDKIRPGEMVLGSRVEMLLVLMHTNLDKSESHITERQRKYFIWLRTALVESCPIYAHAKKDFCVFTMKE